jgi:RhtB (resistance to homoserine/threonine) family protein
MTGNLAAFVGVSVVIICTPGPDTALTVRNALSGGRRAGMWTAAGVATGQAVWTLAAALGLTGLIIASEPAFVTIKLVGAAYLIYLGCQSLHAAFRPGTHAHSDLRHSPRPGRRAMRQGLINDLANPKMAAFFMSLLPQFVSAGDHVFLPMVALGLVFSLLTFVWLAAYSVAIDRLRTLFARSRIRRAIDGIAGAVLIAFGVRIATGD